MGNDNIINKKCLASAKYICKRADNLLVMLPLAQYFYFYSWDARRTGGVAVK